ncbi:hypothetical protein JHK85_035451 [Glycine max]|nr:hypothetical protein JHK85_035451 [Glycine max]
MKANKNVYGLALVVRKIRGQRRLCYKLGITDVADVASTAMSRPMVRCICARTAQSFVAEKNLVIYYRLAFFKAAYALFEADFCVKADDDIYLRPGLCNPEKRMLELHQTESCTQSPTVDSDTKVHPSLPNYNCHVPYTCFHTQSVPPRTYAATTLWIPLKGPVDTLSSYTWPTSSHIAPIPLP